MKTDAEFWDGAAQKYAQSAISDQAAYELTLDRTKHYLRADQKALELGCGTGSTALLLADSVRSYRGTDISPEMISIARAKAEEAGVSNLTFDVAAAHDRIASADVILGHNIFHLTDDLPDLFRRIYEALPPGGLFISKTPCLKDIGVLKQMAFAALVPLLRLVGKAPAHVGFHSSAELEAQIEAAGFEIIEALSAPKMSRYVVARKR